MTKAVCFNCGEFKLGAFNACSLCKRGPETDDQIVMSLALTDHYFDLPTLKVMGKDIKNGKALKLDEQTKENLLSALANLKETTGLKFEQAVRVPPKRPWRKREEPADRNLAKILFIIGILTTLFLIGYTTAYPYRSEEECIHEEIKAGGTAESSEYFCWEERNRDNLRKYGLNPLRGDFVLYSVFSANLGQVSPQDGVTELNEAIATEGTANDSIAM